MEPEARKPNLLIVEDQPELSELIREQFQPLGYRIQVVSCPMEALSILSEAPREYRPDAVISDIAMPKMTGIELMRAVLHLGIQVPFVFLTAYDDAIHHLAASRLGAFDFLTKPYDVPELLWTVDQAISRGLLLREPCRERAIG